MKVLVLTISDRASAGVYEDKSGPAIEETINRNLSGVVVKRCVVPDDEEAIASAFEEHRDNDVILTTGGTGIGPRDVTPEVTANFCDRLIPGIAQYLRSESVKQTVNAVLSRGVAGVRGKTLIVNLPGSVRGAAFCAELLIPIIPHALNMMNALPH